MLRHIHRDMLARVIRDNDYVAWTNGKYNQGLRICRVVGSTAQKVAILTPESKVTRVTPTKLLVVTQQLISNFEENVGANL